MDRTVIAPRVVEVLLESSIGKALDYSISEKEAEQLEVGSLIEVPLQNRRAKGIILKLKTKSEYKKLRHIHSILQSKAILPKDLFELAIWIARYYCCPLNRVIQMILPKTIREAKETQPLLWVERSISIEKLRQEAISLRQRFASQAKVIDILLKMTKGMLLSELLEEAQVSQSPVKTLEKKGLIKIKAITDPIESDPHTYFRSPPKLLNEEQAQTLKLISEAIDSKKPSTHLIHGVTGSGKTEIYIQSVQKALDEGGSSIVLLPEISLTPQTVERFRSRFQERIAILHYRLTPKQRQVEWEAIWKGKVQIVVGARSAIFCPLPNLKLIILDEEHETSYKSEETPHYHAKEVAIERSKLTNSVVILGSATPSLESLYQVKLKNYQLHTLKNRAVKTDLAPIEMIDMKPEYDKRRGLTLFSHRLIEELKACLERNEQALLFLNRRGYFSTIQCMHCGESLTCPHCDITYTYHKHQHLLKCHLCQKEEHYPRTCPSCKQSANFKSMGWGTEHVEDTLKKILPGVKTLRIDADTTRHKGQLEKKLLDFRTHKADILIGTQMIAKGHHFPGLTLACILNPDQHLHIPDYRASETLFQLLVQVAGRAGRSHLSGKVLIQSALPEHALFKFLKTQDYLPFAEHELESRGLFEYPPHNHLIKCLITGDSEKEVQHAAEYTYHRLIKELPKDVLIGFPGPSGYKKIQNKYRYNFVIKCKDPMELTPLLFEIKKTKPFNIPRLRLIVDVDPVWLS